MLCIYNTLAVSVLFMRATVEPDGYNYNLVQRIICTFVTNNTWVACHSSNVWSNQLCNTTNTVANLEKKILRNVLVFLHLLKKHPRHHMEAFSALLDLCAMNSPVTVEFPSKRASNASFDVFFDVSLNKLSNNRRWFETPGCSLWRHCNVILHITVS